eukprot:TRINITY_DN47864_c0_g1_i1.p2 TRINITY_DN47864_c0_g1~~TRINITY_DN47864_c0_g1_i1.p2  ORF type:complete len:202 (+),score=31.92 TRINITY_DN47864_c0_g1_i1:97-702(+)
MQVLKFKASNDLFSVRISPKLKAKMVVRCQQQGIQQVQEKLTSKRKHLDNLVQQEDYEQAAKVRDEINLLEFEMRKMELEYEKEARSKILFSIGTVLLHKRYEYRGVIFGYDSVCKGSEEWIQVMGVDKLPLGRNQPFYHVLVDVRDRPGGQSTYVAQENIIPAQNATEIQHPLINELFREFDGQKYVAGNKLKQLYPDDF